MNKVEIPNSEKVKVELVKVKQIYPYEKNCQLEIMRADNGSEFPLPKEHSIKPGMTVEVVPHTIYHKSGGSITTYEIKPTENKS